MRQQALHRSLTCASAGFADRVTQSLPLAYAVRPTGDIDHALTHTDITTIMASRQ